MTALRHLVLLKWKPNTSAEAINAVKKAVLDLPNQIPNILSYRWHILTGNESDQGYTHLIDSVFVNTEAMLTYDAHTAHRGAVSEHVVSIIDQMLVADHLLPESFDLEQYLKQESKPHFHLMSFITPKPGLDLMPLIGAYQKASSFVDEIVHVDANVRVSNLPVWLMDATQGRTLCVDVLLIDQSSIDKFRQHAHYQQLTSNLKFYADLEEDPLTITYEAGQ